MEPTPYDLTPEQKGLLEALSRKTGKAVSALIAEALEGLQNEVRPKQANEDANSHNGEPPAARPEGTHTPIWERFIEASREIPDEELDRLPADLATQVDHYLYGTPKRPA